MTLSPSTSGDSRKLQAGTRPAELRGQAALPDDLAVLHLQAATVAAHAHDIEPFAIDRRRAARPLLALRHCPGRRPARGASPTAPCRPSRTGPRRPRRRPGCSCRRCGRAATEGALSPPPSPLTFQASGGPSFGHSWSRPRSLEMALRSGPCHCGQSSATAADAPAATLSRAAARVRARRPLERVIRVLELKRFRVANFSMEHLVYSPSLPSLFSFSPEGRSRTTTSTSQRKSPLHAKIPKPQARNP